MSAIQCRLKDSSQLAQTARMGKSPCRRRRLSRSMEGVFIIPFILAPID